MAIPTPTIPSTETPVSAVALRATQNNRAFYINSGLISANNTETTVISVDDVGKRDILFCVNPILTGGGGDDMVMKVKNNGEIIYQTYFKESTTEGMAISPIHFIIPANTSIEVTFANVTDTSSHDTGVSAYGYYMEAF